MLSLIWHPTRAQAAMDSSALFRRPELRFHAFNLLCRLACPEQSL
jgi:hypothetical protein